MEVFRVGDGRLENIVLSTKTLCFYMGMTNSSHLGSYGSHDYQPVGSFIPPSQYLSIPTWTIICNHDTVPTIINH